MMVQYIVPEFVLPALTFPVTAVLAEFGFVNEAPEPLPKCHEYE